MPIPLFFAYGTAFKRSFFVVRLLTEKEISHSYEVLSVDRAV